MILEVRVPALPESVADATLMVWHKQAGDAVTRDDNLIDLETDKVVLEVPAPQSGVIQQIFKHNGEIVKSGELLATLAIAETQTIPPTIPPQTPAPEPSVTQLPAVRQLLEKHQISAAAVPASGKTGRLTKGDVLTFLATQQRDPILAEADERIQMPASPAETTEPDNTRSGQPQSTDRPQQRVPMTRLRARIAERLVQAQHQAAMLTTFNEVNLQAVMDLRQRYQEPFQKAHGVKLGLMSFFVTACVEALKRFPVINAAIDGPDIVYHGYFDLGIAISAPRGLVVPILRDANQKSFAHIETAINEFAAKAKADKLTLDDLTGGTFTISNGGIFGSLLSTPIINPPQSAILGMHAIQQRPIAENGVVVIRPMMYLALSYDHRLVDGREAVQFLVAIKQALEDPTRLLLQV